MSVTKISNRYAKSLIDLCKKQGIMEPVIEDTKAFLELTRNREFELFLKSPIIESDKKLKVFEKLLGSKVNIELLGFFKMVIRKGRENILPEIMNVVLDQYNLMKGVTKIFITSASELSQKELERISAKLKESKLATDKLEFVRKIDPTLIGGFVLEIGDKLYDASIAGKIKKVKKQLIEK